MLGAGARPSALPATSLATDHPREGTMNRPETDDTTTPATLAPATLDGVSGVGVLEIVRGQTGAVESTAGSWHLKRGAGQNRTFGETDIGRSVPYRGPLSDPDRSALREVSLTVRITSVGTYERTPDLGEKDEGDPFPQTIVNFEPVDDLPLDGEGEPGT